MARYFIEVGYKGTDYAGFQIQKNANTIQAEVEKALGIYFRNKFALTGSSRTDAGVHANQNFFHFDSDVLETASLVSTAPYHINALLPASIVVKSIFQVSEQAHCRFDAISRSYSYTVFQDKNPFLQDRGYYYPYNLNIQNLKSAANLLLSQTDFESFAKKNNQAHTNKCQVIISDWLQVEGAIQYHVTANRFLRGMVRGLVGTMLKVGRQLCSLEEFQKIIENRNPSKVDFSPPPQGLILVGVKFK
ncbi:MAG: tRNA pseudouridine(38-40) synthase TruA [Ferruginibacter sp.]